MQKHTLPNEVQALIDKRKILLLEFLGSKRKNSRIDIYMQWLKDFCGKQIYDIDDKDVLEFLIIFNDVNNSGRTIVYHSSCPNLGLRHLENCNDKIRCSFRHAAHSMRILIGIVLKLRKALNLKKWEEYFDEAHMSHQQQKETLPGQF